MPNPAGYDNQKDWMAACVPTRIDEGDKQDQAVAVCLSMWRERNKEMEDTVKERVWEALKDIFKEKPMKSEGDGKHPSSHYLVVEDASAPSTWHLRVRNASGELDHRLMGAAKAALTVGYRGNKYQGPNKSTALAKLKRLYNSEGLEWTKEADHHFMVWKDDETDEYRWLAIYSNKWRDEDNPPEILASTAHKEFVDAVDSGDWNMPEVWLWHVPGTKFGVADYVAYDETGFALASGTVDKGMEYVAERLAADDDLAVSHGMPVKEIKRDTEDPTIITRYRTLEISPLPRESAANKHGTAIQILQEVKAMAIPENKRPFLKDKMGEEGLTNLEAILEDKAKELEEMEIESKEEVEQEMASGQEPEEIGDEEETEPKEESVEENPPVYVTAEEVAEAVGAYLKPLVEQVNQLSIAFQAQTEEIKELKKGGDERLKEELANTPAASLFDRIGSVIGSKQTEIDGRTKLAKAGPEEMTDPSNGPTKVGIINELMAQSWGQQ